MAKSVGNIRLLHGALERARPRRARHVLRRRPLPPADRLLGRRADRGRPAPSSGCASCAAASTLAAPAPEGLDGYVERFFDALADDFNTPAARAVLFEWVTEVNPGSTPASGRRRTAGGDAARARAREAAGGGRRRRRSRGGATAGERQAARAARDFERADAIRDELAALGWQVRDAVDGARLWRSGRMASARRRSTPRRGSVRAARLAAPAQSAALRPQPGPRGAARPRTVKRIWATSARWRARSGCAAATRRTVDAPRSSGSAARRSTRGSAPRGLDPGTLAARRAGGRARDLPRRGPGPAQPRRGLPGRGERGGGWGGDPGAALGRGDAGGRQGVCRSGRAYGGRARRQPRELARRRQAGRGLGLRRRGRAERRRTTPSTTAGGSCWCSDRRGGGCARGSPTAAISWWRCRSAGGSTRSTSRPPRPRVRTESCICAARALTRLHNV